MPEDRGLYYAIPSYLRSSEQNTIDYLTELKIDKQRMFLFVQTESDYEAYSAAHGEKCNIIYRPAGSVSEARNNILNYFSGSADILMMDDDISCFAAGAKGEGLSEIHDGEKFETIVKAAFRITRKLRGELLGFYPVYNDFFMSNSVSVKKPVNTVIGFPKGFSDRFDESFVAKEDIELCGRIMSRGGNIARINNIAFKAKHRTNKGGCYDDWKSGVNEEIAKRLSLLYPGIYATKSNNKREVRTCARDTIRGLKRWEI